MRGVPRLRVVVSFRRARGRLSRFVTGSVAAHAMLLAGVLVIPATRHKAMPIDDTMVVALSGPLTEPTAPRPAAASAPASQLAPPSAPPPKGAHAVREVPISKPKEKPAKPTKEPVKPPTTQAPAPEPKEEEPAPAPPNAQPGGTPGTAGTGVTATVGGGDSALGWYGAAVKAALEAAWIKPYLEGGEGTLSVVLTFDIARDGTARNIHIQQSSGVPSLDRSAERAALEASPFPAVPPAWTADTVPVTMRFDLTPEPR
jgi:TonB family protein